MEVFRLSRLQFASTLSGRGAAIAGARWNSIGVEMLYTAGSRALAMAEVVVHLSAATLPNDFQMSTLFVPDSISQSILDTSLMPAYWNVFPHIVATQQLGDAFILSNAYAMLRVPSAVVTGDYNFLLNPAHAEFKQIQIIRTEPFAFDKRLFQ